MSATLAFADGHQGAEDAWQLASQRHLRSVSVGYRPLESQEVPAGRSAVINGRSYTAPADRSLRLTIRWTIKEVSLVAVGADPAAMIRSSHREGTMIHTIQRRDLDAMTVPQFFRAALSRTRRDLPDGELNCVRAGLSDVGGFNELVGVLNLAITGGFQSAPDSTAGWVRPADLPNFLPNQVSYVETPTRLQPLRRGGTAPHITFGFAEKTGWRLGRFAAQFTIDEQDMTDGKPLGILTLALAELGAAARRLVPDLVYAFLLTNANLADGTALFHANRGNLATGGSSALDATSIDAALAAIAGQRLVDDEGDPIHVNLQPRYLIVPPDDLGPARRHARNMANGDGQDLIVRSESRLTTAGVVDPRDDELVAGNGNNWLLTAPQEQAPGVLVGYLNGGAEPTIRTYQLTGGEWGIGFDLNFDVGVTAVSGKPLYWSRGQ